MKLCHDEPCPECPWREASPAGYLGGHAPEYYADAVQANEVPPCHMQDFGPDDPRSAMCAGALSVMANQCLSAWKTPGGDGAKVSVGRRDDTFRHVAMFYEHHAGQPYVHPLLRSRVA
jgi:hypothetical protein